jgi:multisubunit Na+/H+ antiporter MnhE subunit
MFLLVAALAVEVLFWLARTRGHDPNRMMLLAGVVTGLIVGATLPLQESLTDPSATFSIADVALLGGLGIALGALAGVLAARFTVMLLALSPTPIESPIQKVV